MFYELTDQMKEIDGAALREDALTVGFVNREEAAAALGRFGLAEENAAMLQTANKRFRSGVQVYDDYTFTELRVTDYAHTEEDDDCLALFIKKNLFVVIDVGDHDASTRRKFMDAVRRCAFKTPTLEKVIYGFLDSLIADGTGHLEDAALRMAELEEAVFSGNAGKDFNSTLLKMKKRLIKMHNFYEQLLDISTALDEDENSLFDAEYLRYLANFSQKVIRLREDIDSLSSTLSHVQDAYSAYLDLQLNRSMKVFTVMTSIFFPLTIIAGWYGMNFVNMPELHWRFGYVYVIVLSIAVSAFLIWLGKKKKWY
ncbi:MAG: hypothetical protein IJK89_02155 [Clostridia bacterium]|nr:hypothetical protein [Clostridia bacterium]